jgi:hypothetical protein
MPRPAVILLFFLLGALAVTLFRPYSSSPAVPAPHRGLVRDDHGPVAGARVRFKGDTASALTDADGRFSLSHGANAPRLPNSLRLTAWKDGYLIAGVSSSARPILRMTPLPTQDHEGYEWIVPTPLASDEQRCGNCHVQIHREWTAGAHARSATGKHFRNLYDGTDWHGAAGSGWGLLIEKPDGAGVCSSCHAPTVRDNDPALFDLRKVRGVDALGVHCDYCHKITGLDDGQIGLAHGRFLHRLLRPAQGQLFFGPLDDVDRGEDTFSPVYRDSRYCAACHEGVVFGVSVYTTYSEWLQSPARPAGRHCQDCHMKPTGRMVNFAPGHGGIDRDPHTLASHAFWDGSQEQMLRRCLELVVAFYRHAEGTEAHVRLLAQGVGHRVPTGFIDRQLILVVEGQTMAGAAVVLSSGPVLPLAAGSQLVGKPGKLYARLLKDSNGKGPVPFWRAHFEPEDTRLLPDQPDVRRFRFGPGLARLRVRVLHRRFWAEVAQRKRWPDRDLVVIDRVIDLH